MTLLESLLAASLVAIAAMGFTSALMAGTTQNQLAARYVVASGLAQALMNEILARPFRDPNSASVVPGPEAGETARTARDNIDDYDGFTESAGEMAGADGTTQSDPSLAGFTRHVTARYIDLPGRDASLPPAAILVTVEVKHEDVPLVRLQRCVTVEERP